MTPHPAKFSPLIIKTITEIVNETRTKDHPLVLDPFGGVGGIHRLRKIGCKTVATEIEFEWAKEHKGTCVADAQALPIRPRSCDYVITSPVFGNRMSDSFNAKDKSKRHTYHHYLGRKPSEVSAGKMHFKPGKGGDAYRGLHLRVWATLPWYMQRESYFILNVKNFYVGDDIIDVCGWHRDTCKSLGFNLVTELKVDADGLPHGKNYKKRVDHEMLYVFTPRSV